MVTKMETKGRKHFSHKQIRYYWAEKNIWKRKGYSSKEAFIKDKYTCFACGFNFYPCNEKNRPKITQQTISTPLERAHIKAISIGGIDEIKNIHLLCHHCHLESEAKEGVEYWKWFVKCNCIDRLMGVTVSRYPETIMFFHQFLSEGHSLQDLRTLFQEALQRYITIRDDFFRIGHDVFDLITPKVTR